MFRLASLSIITLLALPIPTRAEDKPATETPASQPAAASQTLEAKDTDALKAAVGKIITVKGATSRVGWSPSGRILFINFAGIDRSGFTAIVEKANEDAVSAFGEGAADLQGKNVEITGEIILYKEKPEIKITKADQIKATGEAAKPPETEKPADTEKKEDKKEPEKNDEPKKERE